MNDDNTKPAEVADPPAAVTPEETAEKAAKRTEASTDEKTTETTTETTADEKPANASEAGKPIDKPTTGEDESKQEEVEGTAAENDGKPSIYRPPPGMLRVSGPHSKKQFVKSDPSSLGETDNPNEIRKQVSPSHSIQW